MAEQIFEAHALEYGNHDYVVAKVGMSFPLTDGSIKTISYWVCYVYLNEELTDSAGTIADEFQQLNISYNEEEIPDLVSGTYVRRALNYPSSRVLGFDFARTFMEKEEGSKRKAIHACRELIWFLNRRLEEI